MTTSSMALREMRRARRTRRLGELEWFEIAYRVYLAALFGGLAVMWLSDLVTDEPVTASQLADVVARGPAVVGLVAVAAVALGLRSGSDGGPISLEVGDARHLMLAPIPRREVLLRPVGQRMRAVAFATASPGRSPASWRPAGCPARRRPGRPAERPRQRWPGSPSSPSPSSSTPSASRAGRRRRSPWCCSPPRLRPSPGAGRDRAMASAAWRCGACARSLTDLVTVRRDHHARRSSPCSSSTACASSSSLAAPTSCRSCASPSRCRTCAPSCCSAGSCAASVRGRRRGSASPVLAGGPGAAVVRRGLRGLTRYPAVTAGEDGRPGHPRRPRRRRRAPRHHAGGAGGRRRPLPSRPRRHRAAVAGDRPP